jgi:unspecific monooxygenase
MFSPTVPPPPEIQPSLLAFLRAVRVNALDTFPRAAYHEWVVQGGTRARVTMTVSSPDAIQHVLIGNHANYRRTPASIRILRPIVGQGLLLSEGDDWRLQRRTIAPALAPRTIPTLAPHIVAATDATVRRLAGARGGQANLLTAMQDLALEIAGRTMFSMEMGGQGQAMRALLLDYGARLARPYLLDIFLPPSWPSPHDLLRQRFRARWMRFVDTLVAGRMAEAPHDPPRDMFDLLRAARDPETGAAFSPAQLRDQTATMIVAGHETTAITLFWSLWLLAQVPEAQARVQAEADGVTLTPETGAEALGQLPYTRAVISEALRLYPPAFTVVRQSIGPDRLPGPDGGTIDIPARATLMIAPWVLHRHRKLWRDPEAFDPERFLGAPPPRFAYLPFGAGPRVCVGAQFAMAEAVLALAGLMRAFDVGLIDTRPVMPRPVVTTVPDYAPVFRVTPRAARRDIAA